MTSFTPHTMSDFNIPQSGYDILISILTTKFHMFPEINEQILSNLSIPYLHESLGANLDQIITLSRYIGFVNLKSQLIARGGYKITNLGLIKPMYKHHIDPSKWHLCPPIYMKCLFKCFKSDILSHLISKKDSSFVSNLSSIAIFNRFDLLEIIYSETNECINNFDIFDQAAGKGNLKAIQCLNSLGAACSTNAMDLAAKNGHLDVLMYLHMNRIEGCYDALVLSATYGKLDVCKYLVENSIGVDKRNEAIEAARSNGHSSIVDYLLSTVFVI